MRFQRGETTLGEVFTFLSGLYFRGKLAYAQAFAAPPAGVAGEWIITSTHGLMKAETLVRPQTLRDFSQVDISEKEPRYRVALQQAAQSLHQAIPAACQVVLLGSIATGKYVDILLEVFGPRLLFPADFVGRGDMSRGGLMLRSAAAQTELPYLAVAGAVRRGARPARLGARSR